MFIISDIGICIELIGFLLLVLSTGRDSSAMVFSEHVDDIIMRIKLRLIPDKFIVRSIVMAIILIIGGLILQLNYFRIISI